MLGELLQEFLDVGVPRPILTVYSDLFLLDCLRWTIPRNEVFLPVGFFCDAF